MVHGYLDGQYINGFAKKSWVRTTTFETLYQTSWKVSLYQLLILLPTSIATHSREINVWKPLLNTLETWTKRNFEWIVSKAFAPRVTHIHNSKCMCIHCGLIYLTSGNLANNELVVLLRRGLRDHICSSPLITPAEID